MTDQTPNRMTAAEFIGPWQMLCERFNRTPSTPVTQFYADIMRGEGLSAHEWMQAVRGVMRFEQFWPSPEQLLEHARGGRSLAALAAEEFDACLARVRAGELATEAGSPIRKLMNSVTHGRPLGHVEERELRWVKREFVERRVAELRAAAVSRTPALTLSESRIKELPYAGD